jgi:hypothetical protein
VAAFLVLGVLVWVAAGAVDAIAVRHAATAVSAADQISADAGPVTNAINDYSTDLKTCNSQLACVTKLDRGVAAALNTFAAKLRAIPMSSQAAAANNTLAAAVSNTAAVFAKLGAATSASQYISEADSSGLQQSLDQVNQAYTNLGTALGQ